MNMFARVLVTLIGCLCVTELTAQPTQPRRQRGEDREQTEKRGRARPSQQRSDDARSDSRSDARGRNQGGLRGPYADEQLQKLQRQAASLHRQIEYSLQRNLGHDAVRRVRRELEDVLEQIRIHRVQTQKSQQSRKGQNSNSNKKQATRPGKKQEENRPKPGTRPGQKSTQKKPAEKKPAERTPTEKKRGEKKRAKKPAEKKPAEKKPAEKKPAEKKPAEKKPAEKKPAEKKPIGGKTGPTTDQPGSGASGEPIVVGDREMILQPSIHDNSAYQYHVRYQRCPPLWNANHINAAIHHLHAAGLSHHAVALTNTGIPIEQPSPVEQRLRSELEALQRQLSQLKAQQKEATVKGR